MYTIHRDRGITTILYTSFQQASAAVAVLVSAYGSTIPSICPWIPWSRLNPSPCWNEAEGMGYEWRQGALDRQGPEVGARGLSLFCWLGSSRYGEVSLVATAVATARASAVSAVCTRSVSPTQPRRAQAEIPVMAVCRVAPLKKEFKMVKCPNAADPYLCY